MINSEVPATDRYCNTYLDLYIQNLINPIKFKKIPPVFGNYTSKTPVVLPRRMLEGILKATGGL